MYGRRLRLTGGSAETRNQGVKESGVGDTTRNARYETVVVPFPKPPRSEARRKAVVAVAACLETVHEEARRAGLKLTTALIGAALLALADEAEEG
jgi:hypothetical protein